MKNATMSVEATYDPSLKLEITGSPNLPTVSNDTNEVAKFFVDLLSDLEVSVTGEITTSAIFVKLAAYVDMKSNSSLVTFQDTGVFYSCESETLYRSKLSLAFCLMIIYNLLSFNR